MASNICNICGRNVPRVKSSNYNTTSLMKHLQKCHNKEDAVIIGLGRQKGSSGKQLTSSEAKERSEIFPCNRRRTLETLPPYLFGRAPQ
uniref:BED-type domain-containing protein n=1 Tax=Cyprinodon variegatus TaxID=28743 RepID=A0A3Q2DRA9_CYPVA